MRKAGSGLAFLVRASGNGFALAESGCVRLRVVRLAKNAGVVALEDGTLAPCRFLSEVAQCIGWRSSSFRSTW